MRDRSLLAARASDKSSVQSREQRQQQRQQMDSGSTGKSGDIVETHDHPVVVAAVDDDGPEKGDLENATAAADPGGKGEVAQGNTFVHRLRRRLTQRRTGLEEWSMPGERHKNCKTLCFKLVE